MAFGPGVFLKLEEPGLGTFLPEGIAVSEAEPCEQVKILVQIMASPFHFPVVLCEKQFV